jgi:hypothetical protein
MVQYNMMGAPIWSSGTFNRPGAVAYLQNDGNLVIYYKNEAIGVSNTCCH